MSSARRFNIALPHELAEVVERKIGSGDYASVSEIMSDGLQALIDRDGAVETWLRDEVLPGYAEFLADPSKAVPLEEILPRIKVRRAAKSQ